VKHELLLIFCCVYKSNYSESERNCDLISIQHEAQSVGGKYANNAITLTMAALIKMIKMFSLSRFHFLKAKTTKRNY
jgi:hypothetical protein